MQRFIHRGCKKSYMANIFAERLTKRFEHKPNNMEMGVISRRVGSSGIVFSLPPMKKETVFVFVLLVTSLFHLPSFMLFNKITWYYIVRL